MPGPSPYPFEQRFWNKVDKKEENDCWNWLGSKGPTGHGFMYYPELKRPYQAYRIAYIIEYGVIPESKHILHSCDNGACVNPKHLRAGTHQENMKDMFDRGRWKKPPTLVGEKHGYSKLSNEQVLEIKKELASISSIYGQCTRLSEKYNVSNSTISLIYRNKIWTHVKLTA
jgi:hypothetical protein